LVSLTDPTLDYVVVTVEKRAAADQNVTFANTYEVYKASGGVGWTQSEIQQIGDAFVEFERSFYDERILFDTVRVSTANQEFPPKTGTEFYTQVRGEEGNVVGSPYEGSILPWDMCLLASRNTFFGRDGRLLYRGLITQVMVEDDQLDFFRLISPDQAEFVVLRAAFDAAWAALFADLPNHNAAMGLFTYEKLLPESPRTVKSARPVTSLEIQGVTKSKWNKRYYNRSDQ